MELSRLNEILGKRRRIVLNSTLDFNNIDSSFKDSSAKTILSNALVISNKDLLRLSYDKECFVFTINTVFDDENELKYSYRSILDMLYNELSSKVKGPLFIDTKAAALLGISYGLENGLKPKYVLDNAYCVMIVHEGIRLYSIFSDSEDAGNLEVTNKETENTFARYIKTLSEPKCVYICMKCTKENSWMAPNTFATASIINMSRMLLPKKNSDEYKRHLEWFVNNHINGNMVYGVNLEDYMTKETGPWRIKEKA